MDEDVHIQPKDFRCQQGHLLADHPQLFHGLDPIETGRGRQVYRAGKFGVGDAGILLEAVENTDVGAIQFAHG
ncbi:hypothetical protein D3C80_2193780 [compost metagenome]